MAPILKKKHKLRGHVKEHVKVETVVLPTGPAKLPLSYYPDERGDRFMIRLTKGFIRNFHPEYDYSNDKFEVQCAKPFNVKEWEHWRNILKILETTHDSRGDGVIDFWHRLPDEDGLGAWFFLFYHAALFVVFQTKDGAI